MFDVLLSLLHCRGDLRSADSIHDFRPYMSFTEFAFYIARDLHSLFMLFIRGRQLQQVNE